jgi:hypothetical protein
MTTAKTKRKISATQMATRDAKICWMREKGATYIEIANKFGITPQRASQIVGKHGSVAETPDDLVMLSECAKIAGVAEGTVSSWATRIPDFPKRYNPTPGQGTKAKSVRESEFRAWLAEHKRRSSHPTAGFGRAEYRKKPIQHRKAKTKRKMKVIIHPMPQPQNSLGGRIKRFLGINS